MSFMPVRPDTVATLPGRSALHAVVTALLVSALLVVSGCGKSAETPANNPTAAPAGAKPAAAKDPTVADAKAFIEETEKALLKLWVERERASWVKATHITHDTELIAARAEVAVMKFVAEHAQEAKKYSKLKLDPTTARKFHLLRQALTLPAPSDAALRDKLAATASAMESLYGKGKWCETTDGGAKDGGAKCLTLGALAGELATVATAKDDKRLLQVWKGWRGISKPMRAKYIEYVKLANRGAAEMGFADVGAMWRSNYDMKPEAFAKEIDRLWGQVRPLYEQLHCLVRARLSEKFGEDVVGKSGPIPAHLLGNMWAQDFSYLSPLLLPDKAAKPFDLVSVLKAKKVDEREMVRIAERFFTSLGLDKLPKTFWERSMFTKPPGREVVCHASAWDIDWLDDLRIKMCIKIDEEDFTTIHHELGHNYYQRAYKAQPGLFTNSANDGFHEALGDTIALSVTPNYLKKIGMTDTVASAGLNPLMRRALEKVAFLPFGVMIDRWRWGVFSGEIKPDAYNAAWWKLRAKYQGVKPPVARSETDFDPGAKYHVAGNVPYIRYFLAHILQFQFHRALCKVAGHTGPLNECSIYGSKEAGAKLNAMMEMGLSRPWPEALEALTGEKQMDATAILDYFAPLHAWLKNENKGRKCGW
jgi:peptidyl-dipeptidase A